MIKNRVNIRKRTIGVNFNEHGEAEVLVWAPFAKSVEILLEQKNKIASLGKTEGGQWFLASRDLLPGDLYKIRIDGQAERPDPASLSQPQGVHGPSQAIDLKRFAGNGGSWQNHSLSDYIIYELHAGTFSTQAGFSGVETKLDYLVQLGVNTIEIMPVAQFPGSRNWGYDGVYPFAVQDSYGGPAGLRKLVDACHDKGLAVVLDVVYNHMGPEGNYMRDFGPYFTSKYGTPWGEAINLDDEWCDGVRDYIVENVIMWFRDFGIDAVRMDAVHALKDFSAWNILQEVREATDAFMKETGSVHYLIVECDLNDPRYLDSLEKGGFAMDAQWIDEFHHALRIAAGGEKQGYYADFDGISHLAKAYKDAYVYDGMYSPHRKKIFGRKLKDHPGTQFVVFSQNHDQVGNRMLGERSSQLVSFEMRKLMAGAVMVSPFIPMLFMGEEYGETNPFLYFVNHTDPELRKMVSEGRKKEFEAFHALGEAPDPSDEATFRASLLQWDLLNKEPHRTLLKFYEQLIGIRKENMVLKNMDRSKLEVWHDETAQTLLLHRWEAEQHLLCLMNFSKQESALQIPLHPARQLKLLMDSASPEWNGPLASASGIDTTATVTLQPESFLIYV
ncbi:MAG: malto-oligosyltrehalose trehalohydrolase [Chitinophagaceae bacterium]|nr:malto-oligosyltrehalose trehalohydrolase [Chitinophagaceae bacterium]